ncbi:SapC family protein [Catenovulum sp. SM1970]|uniref:SapC family protein n=1 Tax=Marinifaba aquimaris TaxID=2741323 RepID=UPI00157322C6|nr:SapC family protein [Marinifaba aquimaris]NTS76613.1 SapC family protein [Marinifaba aquimaris]
MTAQFEGLTKEKHADIKIDDNKNIQATENQHLLPLCVDEFSAACHSYPIVFVKNSETGQFQPVALLSTETQKNNFFQDGNWVAEHLPRCVLVPPFVLIADEKDPEQRYITLNTQSNAIASEGRALFENGEETDYLKSKKELLIQHTNMSGLTAEFCKLLSLYDLLVPTSLTVKAEGQEDKTIDGIFIIDEKKLPNLTQEITSAIQAKNFFLPIYSQLLSLSRTKLLAPKA